MIEVSYDAAVVLTWLSVHPHRRLLSLALPQHPEFVAGIQIWRAEEELLRNGLQKRFEAGEERSGQMDGTATKDGKTVSVAVDRKDRITTS